MSNLTPRAHALFAKVQNKDGRMLLDDAVIDDAIAQWVEAADEASFVCVLHVWASMEAIGPSALGAQLLRLLAAYPPVAERLTREAGAAKARVDATPARPSLGSLGDEKKTVRLNVGLRGSGKHKPN